MLTTNRDSFEVEWDDPADAALTWTRDTLHYPEPIVPLARHVMAVIDREISGTRSRFVNGYPFQRGLDLPVPPKEVLERGLSVWSDDYVPRIRAFCEATRGGDWDGMTTAELVDALEPVLSDAAAAFKLTMVVVLPFMAPTMQLIAEAERELGPDGPRLVASLLQGFDNNTASAGLGLSRLATVAEHSPAVAESLRAGRFDSLAQVEGGPGFLAGLDRFLDEFGSRVESWAFLEVPTWAEDPRVPLGLVARYLMGGTTGAEAAIARSSRDRESAISELERLLAPEKRNHFKELVQAAQHHVWMSEGRAHWQLTVIGVLRRPLLALGRKLVERGTIESADDVFYLEWDEALDAGRSPSISLAALTTERRAEMERWRRLTPPPFLGAPPDESETPPEMELVMKHFFGIGATPSAEKRVVTGFGASKGTVTGRARVIKSLAESERLEPGDILVCVSTAAPWTPLFAVAGGVVTDSGGVLSHSAICAREFAIPCVVGTQVATRKIPDGATITVDGEKGTVRIEA